MSVLFDYVLRTAPRPTRCEEMLNHFSRQLRAGWWLCLVLIAAAAAGPASALSTDRDQPINIEADWAEADDKKGITVYKGKVVIVQGSLRISGDVVTMYFDKSNELQRMIAVGRLARFRQKPDGKDVFQHAKAERIQYNLTTDTMVLTGRAQLSKGEDFIRAKRIVYDTVNARIKGESKPRVTTPGDKAPSGSDRVIITIKPKKVCADGTRRSKCP